MAEDYKYRVLYQFEPRPEGFEKKDIPKGENYGACDAALLVSILYPPDGSLSTYFVSVDGRTGAELDDNELFKIWTLLSKRLSESKTLGEGKRQVADLSFECVRTAVLASKEKI